MTLLSVGVLGWMCAPVLGQLLVDFNSTSQDGGPHPQAGYESYDAGHEVAADFNTKTYSAFGTTVSVTPEWPNTTDNRVRQMIDRAAANDADWVGDKIDLITDWLGADTRTGSGGNGDWDRTGATTPTYLTLTLSGLPADIYQWTSYHHDTENMWSDFQVEVSTDGGSTYGAPIDKEMTSSNTGGNPAANVIYTGDSDPDPRNLPSTVVISLIADGRDVVLRFTHFVDGVDPVEVHKRFFGINGFELLPGSGAPNITVQPQDQDAILGDLLVLTAVADSPLPMTLQWRKGGSSIADATNATLQIDAAAVADAGTYDLVATTSAGSATSDPAAVTVGLPAIAPSSQVVLDTFPATFSITMPTNTMAYLYAWSGPAGPIAGATNAVLTVPNIAVADTGAYSVEVTLGGDTLATSAELIVPNPPTASYPNTILADGPLAYWRLGDPPASATAADEVSPFYDLNVGLSTLLGQPGVILGDSDTSTGFDGTADSLLEGSGYEGAVNPAVFSVEFWARPTGGTGRRIAVGSREVFTVDEDWIEGYEVGLNANGQWEFRTGLGDAGVGNDAWNTLTGPAAAIGSWSHVVASFDGTDMRLFVNGVSVGTLPGVTFTPQNFFALRLGGRADDAVAPGDVFVGDLDEVAIYGSALAASDVLDHYAASSDVSAPPVIATQPRTQGVLIGDPGTFLVSALTGTYPSYQWRRGGVVIAGATNDTLVIDPVELTSAADYDVVVSNAAGSTTSDAASLIPLQDYLGTFVLPDNANTVLTRDGSSDWFVIENQGDANAAGKWNRRTVFNITPVSPWGFQGDQPGEDVGDLELRTTVTSLTPNTDYAVWALFSDKARTSGELSRMASAFDGEELRVFTRNNAVDTGLIAQSIADPWPVYHCFLGVRNSGPSGEIAVLADYANFGRAVYQGVGYQLAVPAAEPPVINVPPFSQAVLIGSNATFSVSASSLLPIAYQWQFNGSDLVGETNATLTVPAVQKADAGTYLVVVSNSEGPLTSPEVSLVALVDYVGTFTYPDSSNTVLTRNGSPDWYTNAQATAESGGFWWARPEYAIPTVPAATNGFFANGAMDTAGDVEVRTTLTGLMPEEAYAVWILYSFPPGGTGSRIGAGYEGEPLTTWDDGLGQDIGVASPTANWRVYQGFLGVRTPNASGELSVLIDYRGLSDSAYNGLGHQLAILPADAAMDIGLEAGTVTVSWPDGSGVLQASEDLASPGAWTDVPGATSPYADPGASPDKAFRLRE